MLVYGDSDIATTADPLITKFDEALPNSRLMYLKGVNPFSQIEGSEECNAVILHFLTEYYA
ncbi:hypothetical protein FOMG_17726 [Fusarium oxysporum f. sp. melonis 26406]|uniref:Uncharacterized protein n=1 Tax=Fusarium oxysporum f. sp. melonis 26406 TaxID=1089452 RepID=W9Z2K9_FUSOX|nr:hypothetical protein FOMG_17726 [Fusarium oxysporum f. sp. melonis 26406]